MLEDPFPLDNRSFKVFFN